MWLSEISRHGAGGLVFQMGQFYRIAISVRALSEVDTRLDMTLDVARMLNSNEQIFNSADEGEKRISEGIRL